MWILHTKYIIRTKISSVSINLVTFRFSKLDVSTRHSVACCDVISLVSRGTWRKRTPIIKGFCLTVMSLFISDGFIIYWSYNYYHILCNCHKIMHLCLLVFALIDFRTKNFLNLKYYWRMHTCMSMRHNRNVNKISLVSCKGTENKNCLPEHSRKALDTSDMKTINFSGNRLWVSGVFW